jgi:hypothetical protein
VLDHEGVNGSLAIFILRGLTIPGEIFSTIVVEAFFFDGINGFNRSRNSSRVFWSNVLLGLIPDLLFFVFLGFGGLSISCSLGFGFSFLFFTVSSALNDNNDHHNYDNSNTAADNDPSPPRETIFILLVIFVISTTSAVIRRLGIFSQIDSRRTTISRSFTGSSLGRADERSKCELRVSHIVDGVESTHKVISKQPVVLTFDSDS